VQGRGRWPRGVAPRGPDGPPRDNPPALPPRRPAHRV